MSDEDTYRKKAEALLSAAAATDNMKTRSQLIDEASYWHGLALEAREPAPWYPANDEEDGQEMRA